MNQTRRHSLIRGLLCAACSVMLAAAALPVQAQDYPSKPITLVVAAAAGGGTDFLARTLAQDMSRELGTPVVVANRAGAAGNIGTDAVAKAAKDGYTLLLTAGAPLTTNVALYAGSLPYDPIKDLAPISLLAETPEFILVNPSFAAQTLDQLVRMIRAEPGKYSFASGGTGTVTHLAGELMKIMGKLELVHVPYRGEGPATNEVLGGQVPMMFGTTSSLPLVRAGKLRALAVTTAQRSRVAPEVPTFSESGFPGFDLVGWYGVLAPAGTPGPILEKLQTVIAKIGTSQAFTEKVSGHGMTALAGSPEQLANKMKSETLIMSQLVKAAGLKPGP